ncbi:MAG: adenylate/guanylate cyclase domain-containing protein, partial [Rhodothermales bacterium]
MLSHLKKLNIKAKILTTVLFIGVVSMGVAGILGYFQGRQALQDSALNNLTAVRATKARQIEGYFSQIHNQIVTLSEDRMVVEA